MLLTELAAAEWAKYKITVNNYAPGGILTPMSEYNLYEPLTILTKKLVLHPDDDINGGPASTAKKASTNSSPW